MSVRAKFGKWYVRFRAAGKRVEFSTGLDATQPNRNAAKNIEAQRRLDVEEEGANRPKSGKPLTFRIAAAEFLAWCHAVEYRAHPNSAKRIQTSFASLLVHFSDSPLSAVDHISTERYKTWRIAEHGIKDVTLNTDLNALSVFMKFCIKANWLPKGSNPLIGEDKVRRPSREDAVRIHVISQEEEQAYFSAATGSVADVSKLMLLQGPRPEEVMALRKSAYDRQAKTIRIVWGKTKAAKRVLHLVEESIAIIERRMKIEGREDSQWLFPSRHHSDKSKDKHVVQLDHSHDTVCQNAGVQFVLYDFRHTFATRMLIEAKVDMASLAAIMGHSNMTLLRKYVHPTAAHQSEAMKMYEATRPTGLQLVKKKA